MPSPGFYNDNEYRAYPFVYTPNSAGHFLPDSAIVDAGFILGLDSGFDPQTHTIWLAEVSRAAGKFTFVFETDAPGALNVPLVFERLESAPPWENEYSEAADEAVAEGCDAAPIWEGFLVTGPLAALVAAIANNQTVTLESTEHVIEPGRVQSLVRGYVRSINLGNFSRAMALPPDECSESMSAAAQHIVVNARCLQGPLRVREGYNCRIRQVERTNELRIAAEKNAGTPLDADQCQYGGELPLYPSEPLPDGSKFFSGGPACDELIATINGVGGGNVNIIGGSGVTVTADAAKHKVSVVRAVNNIVGGCAASGSE